MSTLLNYFEWFYLLGYISATIIRVYFTNKYKPEKNPKKIEFSLDSLLLTITGIGMIIPILYLFTPWFGFGDYNAPAWLNWLGVPTMIGFNWLLFKSHQDLHKNWSPNIEVLEKQSLVTTGVYGLIRHPMYAAHLLWGIGQAFLLSNWFAGLSLILPALLLCLYRIPREEKLLIDSFGNSYLDYCYKTNRLLPKFSSLFS